MLKDDRHHKLKDGERNGSVIIKRLQEKYAFPETMPAFLLTTGMPMLPTDCRFKVVEGIVFEENDKISISHPSFKYKGFSLYANHIVDARMWHCEEEKGRLLILVFSKIIERNHGEFEVCCHKDSEKWKNIHSQAMADIIDHRECLLHMVERLGLWEGVFGC